MGEGPGGVGEQQLAGLRGGGAGDWLTEKTRSGCPLARMLVS